MGYYNLSSKGLFTERVFFFHTIFSFRVDGEGLTSVSVTVHYNINSKGHFGGCFANIQIITLGTPLLTGLPIIFNIVLFVYH